MWNFFFPPHNTSSDNLQHTTKFMSKNSVWEKFIQGWERTKKHKYRRHVMVNIIWSKSYLPWRYLCMPNSSKKVFSSHPLLCSPTLIHAKSTSKKIKKKQQQRGGENISTAAELSCCVSSKLFFWCFILLFVLVYAN